MSGIHIPDAQQAFLDALIKAWQDGVVTLVGRGVMTNAEANDLADFVYGEEPESVVFYAGDLADEDPEDRVSIVNMVGARDLDAKIRHWTQALENLREDYS